MTNGVDPVATPNAMRIENTSVEVNGIVTDGETVPGSNIRFLTRTIDSTYYANLTYDLGVVVKEIQEIKVSFESYTSGTPSDAFSTVLPSIRNKFTFTETLE